VKSYNAQHWCVEPVASAVVALIQLSCQMVCGPAFACVVDGGCGGLQHENEVQQLNVVTSLIGGHDDVVGTIVEVA